MHVSADAPVMSKSVVVKYREQEMKCIPLIFNLIRCLDPRFGRRKDLVCVVRRAENELLRCIWIVLMLMEINPKHER